MMLSYREDFRRWVPAIAHTFQINALFAVFPLAAKEPAVRWLSWNVILLPAVTELMLAMRSRRGMEKGTWRLCAFAHETYRLFH